MALIRPSSEKEVEAQLSTASARKVKTSPSGVDILIIEKKVGNWYDDSCIGIAAVSGTNVAAKAENWTFPIEESLFLLDSELYSSNGRDTITKWIKEYGDIYVPYMDFTDIKKVSLKQRVIYNDSGYIEDGIVTPLLAVAATCELKNNRFITLFFDAATGNYVGRQAASP